MQTYIYDVIINKQNIYGNLSLGSIMTAHCKNGTHMVPHFNKLRDAENFIS